MREPSPEDLSLLTIDEAARLLGLPRRTVRSWVRRRGLTVWRRPGQPMLLSEMEVLQAEHATRRAGRGRHRGVAAPVDDGGS